MIPTRALRDCLDGVIPGVVSTCAPDGTPNVAYMSQGQYLDDQHLALSYQFFNRTRQNLLANPRVTLGLIHPQTAQQYRVHLVYERTETSGPVFESMKAKLAGIASHTGMSGVFRLLGSDIYRIERSEVVPGSTLPAQPPAVDPLLALRTCMARLPQSPDAESLLDALLDGLQAHFRIEHALVMMLDPGRDRLYTVASRGYPASGVGSELRLGDGVIGVAARERNPIRISHMTSEYAYGLAQREGAERRGLGDLLETEIPFPGLAAPGSQLAVPIPGAREPIGVLFAESPTEMRFTHADEDALVALATQVGGLFRLFLAELELGEESQPAGGREPRPDGVPLRVRHYAANDSVFLGDDYLIKGVAGNILWTLLQDHQTLGRTQFSNRELRADPRVRLPDQSDNLEARLVLLHRRLAERRACVQLEKTGRGRFRLLVTRPLELEDMDSGA
ncbi:GAF domain-containing protein [Geothrix fermentans]|uniref:GAF domain-containing protein n=1 Tax=Geothrix fermentans TaxID=44676 RepID=UPI0004017570|nr:GAF domain-containing protein [Geothrix fermentans]